MLIVELLLAFVLAVQDKPQAMGTLSGTVVNSVTGAPLNKVEVRAIRAGAKSDEAVASTTTDAKGNYTLIDLAPGDYRLRAIRSGYLDTDYGDVRRGLTWALAKPLSRKEAKAKKGAMMEITNGLFPTSSRQVAIAPIRPGVGSRGEV